MLSLSTTLVAAGLYALGDFISIKLMHCIAWYVSRILVVIVSLAIARYWPWASQDQAEVKAGRERVIPINEPRHRDTGHLRDPLRFLTLADTWRSVHGAVNPPPVSRGAGRVQASSDYPLREYPVVEARNDPLGLVQTVAVDSGGSTGEVDDPSC